MILLYTKNKGKRIFPFALFDCGFCKKNSDSKICFGILPLKKKAAAEVDDNRDEGGLPFSLYE